MAYDVEYDRNSAEMEKAQEELQRISQRLETSGMNLAYALQYVLPRVKGEDFVSFLKYLNVLASAVIDLSIAAGNTADNLSSETESAKVIEGYFS